MSSDSCIFNSAFMSYFMATKSMLEITSDKQIQFSTISTWFP